MTRERDGRGGPSVNRDDPLAVRRSPGTVVARTVSSVLGRRHVEPDFVVIGAARAGTTSLVSRIKTHPGVLYCPREELHFFDMDSRWSLGVGSYRRRFPRRAAQRAAIAAGNGPAISGEGSPYYLAHPYAAERVRATLPDVRLMALLRDPTERAISHWNWRFNQHHETRRFEQVAEEELAALADVPPGGSAGALADSPDAVRSKGGIEARSAVYSTMGSSPRARRYEAYLARGIYLEQLQRWHALFPRDQLLVLISERYYADPDTTMDRVFDHLRLPSARTEDTKRNALKRKEPVDPEVIERVRAFFRPHNEALAAYLGEPLEWR